MQTKPVSFPFPVADTSTGPVIQWKNDRLTVEFSDHEDAACLVSFHEVPHFEWLTDGELDPGVFPYDGVVEVIESPLIDRMVKSGGIAGGWKDEYRHLVIGFNEVGAYLVIVCRRFGAAVS
jgi:hypothetical protein